MSFTTLFGYFKQALLFEELWRNSTMFYNPNHLSTGPLLTRCCHKHESIYVLRTTTYMHTQTPSPGYFQKSYKPLYPCEKSIRLCHYSILICYNQIRINLYYVFVYISDIQKHRIYLFDSFLLYFDTCISYNFNLIQSMCT